MSKQLNSRGEEVTDLLGKDKSGSFVPKKGSCATNLGAMFDELGITGKDQLDVHEAMTAAKNIPLEKRDPKKSFSELTRNKN